MKIREIVFLEPVIEKLAVKHHIQPEEVEEVFRSHPHVFFLEEGQFQGEDLYAALGRTEAGRRVIVFFIYKRNRDALILSARPMTEKERRRYEKKRQDPQL